MSAKYTFLAWDTPIDNAPLKLALLQLANNADDDGFSYYSISKMAIACGMSERSFMRKIQELEKKNVLTVERRSNRPSLYTLIGDEMGVTLCHLQSSEVTECHAEVTESHLVGDSVSRDPNSTPKKTPNNTCSSLNYSRIKEIYNESLPRSGDIQDMPPLRKAKVKKFFTEFKFTEETFRNYLKWIDNEPECNWMFEKRLRQDGVSYWQKQKFDYFISEKAYLLVKEMEG